MTDYLIQNTAELIVVGVAFCFSKPKSLPFFLVLYISIMTIVFGENNEYMAKLDSYGVNWEYYNKELALTYLYEGSIMIFMGAISFATIGKLRALTAIVIAFQAMISIVIAINLYAFASGLTGTNKWLYDMHYSLQGIFVVLYCLIAWMCVYYSRKSHYEH